MNANSNQKRIEPLSEKRINLKREDQVVKDFVTRKYHNLVQLAQRYQTASDKKDSVAMTKIATGLKTALTQHMGANNMWYSIKVDRVDISIDVLPILENGQLLSVHFWYQNHTNRHVRIDTSESDLLMLKELFKTLEW